MHKFVKVRSGSCLCELCCLPINFDLKDWLWGKINKIHSFWLFPTNIRVIIFESEDAKNILLLFCDMTFNYNNLLRCYIMKYIGVIALRIPNIDEKENDPPNESFERKIIEN